MGGPKIEGPLYWNTCIGLVKNAVFNDRWSVYVQVVCRWCGPYTAPEINICEDVESNLKIKDTDETAQKHP